MLFSYSQQKKPKLLKLFLAVFGDVLIILEIYMFLRNVL